jgi:ubiquinone/menaquinone biosynthesis C-methylase UbiE
MPNRTYPTSGDVIVTGPSTSNLLGHRTKYSLLMKRYPAEEALKHYVGGSDPVFTGFVELEVIRRYRDLDGIALVDIGCGIGRLTMHVVHEPIKSYVGTDILPEIIKHAQDIAQHDSRFSFFISDNCKVHIPDGQADIVVAFSVITHLLDEECFEYFVESRRVLKPNGIALFTYLDFNSPYHRSDFFQHARRYRSGQGDLLRFTTSEILNYLGKEAGFAKIEHFDGSIKFPASGKVPPLMASKTVPSTVAMGQSICALYV